MFSISTESPSLLVDETAVPDPTTLELDFVAPKIDPRVDRPVVSALAQLALVPVAVLVAAAVFAAVVVVVVAVFFLLASLSNRNAPSPTPAIIRTFFLSILVSFTLSAP
jgi:hypothetical protein